MRFTVPEHLKRLVPLCAALLAACIASAQSPTPRMSATAYFEPPLIHADEHTIYVLQITDAQGGISGDMPHAEGLRVIGPQQSGSSVSIINGVTTVQRSIRIPMAAAAPGDYLIPGFQIEVNGIPCPVPEARLQVLPVDEKARAAAAAATPLKLHMQLPQGPYYVGQAIPVSLVLNTDPQVSLSGSSAPAKIGSDNYILSPFTDLGAQRAEAGGQIINQYRMGTIVTPLTAGDISLGFEQTVLAYIPQNLRPGRPRQSADPFAMGGDPFAQFFGRDSLFDRMTNREELRLRTQEQSLSIEPLPAQGRPQHFSGAIGSFTLGAPQLSTQEVRVGEPLTLSFTVQGTGNFDRIQPPPVVDEGNWRSYTPHSRFQPQDPVGYSGAKTFEYTLIARSEAITHTPQIDFSYFDPSTGTYVELPVPPQAITVTPGEDIAPLPPAKAASQPPSSREAGDGELLPPMLSLGKSSGTLSLLVYSPAFYAAQLVPALALCGFVLYRRHRLRMETDPRFARRHLARQRIREALAAANKHAASGNTAGFYRSAAAALQEWLSIDEPEIVAASLASGELEARLKRMGADATQIARARLFLHEADALQYGSADATTPLEQRRQELQQLLADLQKKTSA